MTKRKILMLNSCYLCDVFRRIKKTAKDKLVD